MTSLRARQAGVCLHLSSLPGAHGIGTLGRPAQRFVDFVADAGLGVWQVLQFLVDQEDFDLQSIPENCACYVGTHDNDTVQGWYRQGPQDCGDAEALRHWQSIVARNARGCAETVHLDLLRLAFASSAVLALGSIQDFLGLGSEARFNTPGSTTGNWQWRCTDDQLSPHFRASVAALTTELGRTNEASAT